MLQSGPLGPEAASGRPNDARDSSRTVSRIPGEKITAMSMGNDPPPPRDAGDWYRRTDGVRGIA